MIPIFGEEGQVTEVYGRKITPGLREGTPLHLYLPGPHRGIWNRSALEASKEIILCESLIDALTFWCAGFRNVTTSYGVEGFTRDHLAAFKQSGTERVLIAYDRDAAGDAAAEKLSKQLQAEGLDCYRIQFAKGMDANAYALEVRPAAKSLGIAIRSALWLGKGSAKPITTTAATSASAAESTEKAEAASAPGLSRSSVPSSLPSKPPVGVSSRPGPAERGREERREPEPNPSLAAVRKAAEEAGEGEEIEADAVAAAMPASSLPALILPPAPKALIAAEVAGDEIVIGLGDRRYRIRGLGKNASLESLRVNVLVTGPSFEGVGQAMHVDTFDLYQQRPRKAFTEQAAVELGVQEEVIRGDLGKILLKLEAVQAERIEGERAAKEKSLELGDDDRRAALDLLRDPNLLARIERDFERCGVVGEGTNKLVGYLAGISRKLDAPLAIVVQSTSAAGKSALMDAVLAFIPEEERTKYSAMTGQSLFYMGERDLQHKVLAIVEEEGASTASYALKLLQSEGELTIASTGKDPETGALRTQEYQVKGPVMIMLTTTAIDVDEELLNRCIVLTVDEGREQTRAIHAIQRRKRTLSGLLAKAGREEVLRLHRNAQRLLQPLFVVNPYGERLTFVDDRTRTRRDHEKYLTLIDAIALLHQHQRRIQAIEHEGKTLRYIEVDPSDIETANRLAHEVLGRTLDELPPKTRELLRKLDAWVRERCRVLEIERADFRFSRRDIRDATQWSDTSLKVHLGRLAEMEYLLVHRSGRGQSFAYELLYQGEGERGESFLMGLIDVADLGSGSRYDDRRSGRNGERSGSGQALVGPRSGVGPDLESAASAEGAKGSSSIDVPDVETALRRPPRSNGSYRSHGAELVARAAD